MLPWLRRRAHESHLLHRGLHGPGLETVGTFGCVQGCVDSAA